MDKITLATASTIIRKLKKKGAVHIFVGNFLNKFMTLCGSIFVVRLLTKQEYGTLSYIENLCTYVYIFSGMGLAAAILRYIVLTEDRKKQYAYYRYTLRTQTIYNICMILFVAFLNVFYQHPSQYIDASWLFLIILIDIPFSDVVATNLSVERAYFANKKYVWLSLMTVCTSVVLRIVGSYCFGIDGNITFRIIADGACAIVLCIIVIVSHYNQIECIELTKTEKIELNRYAIQNMLANGFWVLYSITDMFLLGRLINNAGILADYRVAMLVSTNILIATNAVSVFVSPYFVQNEKDCKWVIRNYKKVLAMNVLLLGSIAFFLIILAKPVVHVVFGENYLATVPLMRILLVASFMNGSFRAISSSLLAAMGHSRTNMILSGMGFLMQIILCLVIIPRYGVTGLAVENVIMYTFLSVAFVVAFFWKFNDKSINRII